MKTTLLYVETIAILIVVAVVVHFVVSIDWPWAVALGAAAAVLIRALLQRRLRATVATNRSRRED